MEVRGDLVFLLQGSPEKGLAVFQMKSNGELELLGEAFDERLLIPIDLIVHRDVVHAIVLRPPYAILGYRGLAKGRTPNPWDSSSFSAKGGVEIIDLDDPSNPRPVAVLELDRPVTGMAMDGDYLLAVHSDGGMTLVDLENPSKPTVVSQLPGSEKPGAVQSFSRAAKIAFSGEGHLAYVISSPPSRVATATSRAARSPWSIFGNRPSRRY